MKKKTAYIITSIFNFIGGTSFLLAAVMQENTVPKYMFYIAALCLIVSGTGFLHMYFKEKTK